MFKHILLATDGTEMSSKAGEAAITLALAFSAQIIAYVCIPLYSPPPYGDFIVDIPANFIQQCENEAQSILNNFLSRAQAAGANCHALTNSATSVYLGIISTARAEKCDLIIMGSHGKRGLADMLIGSESQRVISHIDIPVLIYQ